MSLLPAPGWLWKTTTGSAGFVAIARLLPALAVCGSLPAGSPSARGASPALKEVVVVFKTHFDIGYTDLVTNVLTRYRTTFLDDALKLIEDSRGLPPDQQFVWTVPGWPLHEMLWPGQTPERREKVLRALKDRRLAVHALPFTVHTESLDLEDLVRGLKFSADLARENGLPLPRAAKMTDVPEHTWILPTLLKHAGIDFLHLGCNGGSKPMRVPPLFWWEGPDGSRLLTAYSAQYGTALTPPRDWPYQTWLAMVMTGDNHGPPTAAAVARLLQQAARELPGVKIKFGTLEDFYDAISAEKSPLIPVVRGDMPDTWIHGFGAMPAETKLARNVRPLEGALGALDTELRATGLTPPPAESLLDEAYEQSLLYSEHTFGFNGSQPGGFWYGEEWKQALAEGKYARFEQSFDDKRNYMRSASDIITNALNQRMRLLAQNVAIDGARICVFNPLPWKRSDVVELARPGGKCSDLQDLATGRRVASLAAEGSTLRFLAEDVPPTGYKTYRVLDVGAGGTATSSPAGGVAMNASRFVVLQNRIFRLQVDRAGGRIASLKDLKTGRELVAVNDETGFGQYLHEQFSSNNVQAFLTAYCRATPWVQKDFGKPGMPGPDKLPYARVTLTNWTMSVRTDAVAQTVILRSADATPLAQAVTIRYTLYAAQPCLDIEWAVEGKTPNPLPEGGWFCLPFAIDRPVFKLGRLGSWVDPATEIIPGANQYMFFINSGLTLTGPDGYGVGLCPIDSPLVSLGGPGLWKFSLAPVSRSARVFVNLYNNQWDTNFPLWQGGSWTSRVRLWLLQGRDVTRNLVEPAWEARAPLLATWSDGPPGKLPAAGSGLALSRRGILATCFGPGPYGEQVLVRLWELAGRSGPVTITLPPGLKATQARPVNLRGEPEGQAIPLRRGKFKSNLPAFSPASYVLDTPGGTALAPPARAASHQPSAAASSTPNQSRTD